MRDALTIAGEGFRRGTARPQSNEERRMGIYFQWRWLIELRTAPPVVTAMGDLLPGDVDLHRGVARGTLEWALRIRESK